MLTKEKKRTAAFLMEIRGEAEAAYGRKMAGVGVAWNHFHSIVSKQNVWIIAHML